MAHRIGLVVGHQTAPAVAARPPVYIKPARCTRPTIDETGNAAAALKIRNTRPLVRVRPREPHEFVTRGFSRMGGWGGWAGTASLCGVRGATSVQAAETYTYAVQHPTFGEIGTYTDRIERGADQWQVETTLHVAVRVLGIVVHREEAARRQVWRHGRLVRFEGVTTTNGSRLEIQGTAQGDRFTVVTPHGTAVAPVDVVLSDPWQATPGTAQADAAATMLSTKTGRLGAVRRTDGAPALLSVHGVEIAVRHYSFASDKRQEVWVDQRGVPVQFRTIEDGTPIDFVLSRETLASLAALPK